MNGVDPSLKKPNPRSLILFFLLMMSLFWTINLFLEGNQPVTTYADVLNLFREEKVSVFEINDSGTLLLRLTEEVEGQTSKALYILARSARAMFRIGLSIELHSRGYRYERMVVPMSTSEQAN